MPGKDYVDKALESAERKAGMNPKYMKYNEKITDKLRNLFEKKTGKKVPSKISN
ncbi:hypothetical protein BTJ68_07448 [Hortaea werneckii EXF-2000]|uniref:Uncharacterized protein n=2 Tax=Hortaea werneckii TaxID=91943 RepID=A0A3M7JCL4_HORWE|nr:hypothetical protein BTJ68_07448 [Hortaea werneckii EXF-2000]RMZ35537.1 hypothetical protein D0859_00343 [Hortaea werneckii]